MPDSTQQNSQTDKVQIVFWDERDRSPEALELQVVDRIGPELLPACDRLTALVHDVQAAKVRCPAPPRRGESRPAGMLDLWPTSNEVTDLALARLREAGFRPAAWRVEETVYTQYGDNRWGKKRDWPDGARSPGVVLLTLMERPRRLSKDEWLRRWYGRQSPVSEQMQPRARYVRNLVLDAITPDAPPVEGIVEEAWPDGRHVENPFLFYGARNPVELVINQAKMMASVLSFLNILKLRTQMVGEYFLKS
ncbi:MAG: hypothetical protein D6761_04695 [Candidatus Dadabacteria bacterium]|nr:MAG: hypothetical protein D6761_04695 [Candidatus Dadabacteria bacterium]